jgi:hypothetical protein
MTTVGLLHRDRRIRALYQTLLEGRGYGVVARAPADRTPETAVGCDLLVLHVGDGASGLLAAIEVLRSAEAAVLAIDDDPEPARHRALRGRGAARVLDGPVRLRDLVDAVTELVGTPGANEDLPDAGSLRVLRDSARHRPLQDVRGDHRGAGHHLALAGAGLDVSVHSYRRGPALRVVGTVTGPSEPVLARVRMDHASGTATARTDAQGRFVLTEVAPGPVRLRIECRSCALTADVEVGAG